MQNQMCVYPIREAPYLAVSNVQKMSRGKCLIEDTRGRLKRVRPIYVGPFDHEKVLQLGALVSRYISDRHDAENNFNSRSCSLFNLVNA